MHVIFVILVLRIIQILGFLNVYLMGIVPERGGRSLEPVLSSGVGASPLVAVQGRVRGNF